MGTTRQTHQAFGSFPVGVMCGSSGWITLQMCGFTPAKPAPQQEPFPLIPDKNFLDLLLFIIVVFTSIILTNDCVVYYY